MSNLTYQPGKYRVRVTNWGMNKTGTGKPQFILSFQPQGIINQADPNGELMPCPMDERSIFRVITPDTMEYVAQDLRRLGYPYDTFDQLNPHHPQSHNFRGLQLDVVCDHETYQGKTRDKWRFAWGGGFTFTPLEDKEVKQLNALFGRKLKETKLLQQEDEPPAESPAEFLRPPAPEPRVQSDAEEIPF